MKKELMIIGLCGLIAGLSLAGSYWLTTSNMQNLISQQQLAQAAQTEQLGVLRKQITQLRNSVQSDSPIHIDNIQAANPDGPQFELIFEQLKELKQVYGNLESLVNNGNSTNEQLALNELQGEQALNQHTPPPIQAHDEAVKAVQQQFQTFHSELLAEEIDSQWSVPATEMLETAVNAFVYEQPEANLLMHDVDCRSTMCRLDLGLDGGVVKAEEFHMSLLTQLGTQVAGLQRKKEMDAKGRVRSVYYLKRKG